MSPGSAARTVVHGERPWPAPAKLNLFLHILGRRPDGYHELQTCFQFVDLCDDIHIRVRLDGAVTRLRGAAGVAEDSDLCVRAARALQAASQCRLGADIDVVKRIPMGAGLGGGSSDAATCLVALNRLWGLDWPAVRLAALGLTLGADVPVFVHGRAAWAEGVSRSATAPTPKGPARCSSAPSLCCCQSKLACQPCVPIATAARPESRQVSACCNSADR